MDTPRDFFAPLALGAPHPLREIPLEPTRVIHFFDPSDRRMVSKLPHLAVRSDVLLGNLEDAVPSRRKAEARRGLIEVGRDVPLGHAQLWTRINALDSQWALDDITQLVLAIGERLNVIMVPKVESARDIHYIDRLLAQLEAKAELSRPVLVHPILETAKGVAKIDEIASASPRVHGMSFGPADLAASRRMKTTRVGGGHPGYAVLADGSAGSARRSVQQDPWHSTIVRMVDACVSAGILPFYGPYADIADINGCEAQFRAAFVLGCVGAWSLHPTQIDVARAVFSPDPEEVAYAKRVVDALPDGEGVVMIDGKMQDDGTWKQCRVLVDLAAALAQRDREFAAAYGL